MILTHLRIEFSILATLGPTIGAIVAQRLASGTYRALRFNVSWPRTLGAAALGIALVIISFDILPALATVDARALHWSALISFRVYNYSTLLGGPLFEEPGWRGFALPRLEAQFGPLPAALLLGTIWAAWHLPLFLYPGWSNVPI
jgi:membrane protease YdiL (CAAX protease family)